MPSMLSEILEESADAKYALSKQACIGILNRAARRGKNCPTELKEALEIQAGIRLPGVCDDRESESDEAGIPSACKGTESTGVIPQAVTEPDGGGGGSYTLNTIDRPAVLDVRQSAGPAE